MYAQQKREQENTERREAEFTADRVISKVPDLLDEMILPIMIPKNSRIKLLLL